MKYKVGDRVKIREDLIIGKEYGDNTFVSGMMPWRGQVVTISRVGKFYQLDHDDYDWDWTDEMIEGLVVDAVTHPSRMNEFPQDKEQNEYRYLSPAWMDAVATGLTKGAEKHPWETWRTIPCEEHCWRAIRHLTMYLKGDRSEKHLDNASMRVMMAWETEDKDGQHR